MESTVVSKQERSDEEESTGKIRGDGKEKRKNWCCGTGKEGEKKLEEPDSEQWVESDTKRDEGRERNVLVS